MVQLPGIPNSLFVARRRAGLGVCIVAVAAVSGCIDPDTRKQMAESESILGGLFTDPTPIDAARWSVDEYDADKRARGTLLLANAPFGGGEPYLKLYRQHLTDEGPLVRAVASRALGMHGTPEDAVLLLPVTSDTESLVRFEAVRSLQRLHNPKVVARLVELLRPDKELDSAIRAEAAAALGQYAEPRVLDALIAALADDNLVVVASASESLRTLTGRENTDEDRREWATWAQQTTAPFADRRDYTYPVFSRDKRWLDHLPFMPAVPNEVAGRPQGMPG